MSNEMMAKDIKEVWTATDYPSMGWHDCRIYNISFLNERYTITVNIDYIFDAKLINGSFRRFLISPAEITFFDASYFLINIDSKNTTGANIENLALHSIGKSENGKVDMFQCVIDLDIGELRFETSGFKMVLKNRRFTRLRRIFADWIDGSVLCRGAPRPFLTTHKIG